MNETYRWDPAEGIIGVVGVAPAATADFYQRITALTIARKDWEHVRVLIDSNPKLPSRGRHLELGETDPSPFIAGGIRALLERGATVVAIPCNTAHILYERYTADLPVRWVPNMISLAVNAFVHDHASVPQRAAVLGSRHTVSHDLYGRRLRPLGGGCLDVSPWQQDISALIEHVKQGGDIEVGRSRLRTVMDAAANAGADGFFVACTELSLLVSRDQMDVPLVDSSDSLARHCLAAVKQSSGVLA